MSSDQGQQTVMSNGKTGLSHEQVLASISGKIQSFKSTKYILNSLKMELRQVFSCDAVTIFSLNRDKGILHSCNFDASEKAVIEVDISTETLAGFVAATGKPINIVDAYSSDELAQYHPNLKHGAVWDEMYDSKTKSLMVTPLSYDGKLAGVMEVINKKGADRFSEEDFRSAKTIAPMVGLLLAKLEYEEMEQERSAKLRIQNGDLVHDISQVLHSAKDIDQILLSVKDNILELFEAVHITIYAVDEKRNELYSKAKSGEGIKEIRVPISTDSIAGGVALERRMLNVSDVRDREELKLYHPDLKFNEALDVMAMGNSKAMLVFPLICKQRLMGVLQIINRKIGDGFNGMDEKNAFVVAETLALAFYNQQKNSEHSGIGRRVRQEEVPSDGRETDEMVLDIDVTVDELEGFPDNGAETHGEIGSPAVNQIAQFLSEAHGQGVTAIHIEKGVGDLKLRFRNKGGLYEDVPRNLDRSVVSTLKIMANLDVVEPVLPQNGKAKLDFGSTYFEIQVATFPLIDRGEDIIVNILSTDKPTAKLVALSDLDFSRANQAVVESAITKTNGLIVVCGAKGSGKTTLLHSLIHFIDMPGKRMMTVENQVEIKQEGLRQIQLDLTKGLTFSYALRAFLMGDPDVIMVEEIPDKDTCRLALVAAEEHLVLSSVESPSAYAALKGLISLCADPARLVGSTIINQKLVETLCVRCKEEYYPSQEEFNKLVDAFGVQAFAGLGITHRSDLLLRKSVGCKQCAYSGYKGQIGIQEVMPVTPEILSLIRQDASEEKIRNKAVEKGMTNSKQDGILKVFQGVCDLKKVLEACR